MSVNHGKKCVGCHICVDVCPVNAIHMERDDRGFDYPLVDLQTCIQCGKCDRQCPIDQKIEKFRTIDSYAAKNKNEDIRHISSSGGMFIALASYVIEKNGVVYGCKLNDKLVAVYGRAETLEDCKAFMGSKYVQSDMAGVIEQITSDLQNDRWVLFTGSPCEAMAIRHNFPYSKYDRLIICDYLCHGGPSPMVFEDFKKYMEKKYHGRITSMTFRDKEKVAHKPSSRGIRMWMNSNGKTLDVYDETADDMYFELFKFNYISRLSCYDCPCIGFERFSDISIGDYWGCEKYHPEFFDKEGISLAMINTKRGKDAFNSIQNLLVTIQIKEDEIFQPMLMHSPEKKNNYDEVWEIYHKDGFEKAALTVNRTNRMSFIVRLKIKLARDLPLPLVTAIRKIKK